MSRSDPTTRVPAKLKHAVDAKAEAEQTTRQWVWNDIYNMYFLSLDHIYRTPAAGDAQLKTDRIYEVMTEKEQRNG